MGWSELALSGIPSPLSAFPLMLALPESGHRFCCCDSSPRLVCAQGTKSKEVDPGDALKEIIDSWAGET